MSQLRLDEVRLNEEKEELNRELKNIRDLFSRSSATFTCANAIWEHLPEPPKPSKGLGDPIVTEITKKYWVINEPGNPYDSVLLGPLTDEETDLFNVGDISVVRGFNCKVFGVGYVTYMNEDNEKVKAYAQFAKR